MTELRENVKGVWSAMEAGKEDVTKKIMTVGQGVDKLGQGVKEIKEGQGQLEKEMGRNATAIEGLRQSQQETRDELEAVKEVYRARHEEMAEIVGEMGRKVETETQEMGERLDKHEGETKEELAEMQGEIVEIF